MRVQQRHQQLLTADPLWDNPFCHLQLLKTALWDTARLLAARGAPQAPTTADDKIGWCMSCLRAAERCSVRVMEKCCSAYPPCVLS